MPPDWFYVVGFDPSHVLRHFGFVDVTKSLASDGDRRRWHVRGTLSGCVMYVCLVVHPARLAALPGIEHHVFVIRDHVVIQCESFAAIRWVLHSVGLLGSPQPGPEVTIVAVVKTQDLGRRNEARPSHLLPEKKLISVAIYGVLALAYRIFVMIAIGWFIHEIMQPYGMQAFAHVFIFMSLSGLLIMPIFKLVKFFSFPGRFREVDKQRTWISAVVLAAVLFVIGYVPFPHYVWADFIVRPMGAQNLIVTHEGHLQQVNFCEGDFVKEGETIAVIENHELKLQYEELLGQLARLESDRIAFEYLSTSEIDSARKLAETVAELKGVRRQLDVMENKLDELEIRARQSGRLFAPQNIASSYLETGQLPSWSDTPLAPKNQGAFLEANTLLGSIGNNEQMEIILVVNESDVEYLSVGQPVTALSKSASNTFLHGELTVVADDQLDLLPRELSQTNRGPIAVEPDSEGKERPLLKFYEAYVGLDSRELMDANVQLLPGSIGKARVLVGQMSIGNRLLRYVQSVIKFR